MLLKITSPTARNDASIRLCEVWNKPKQSLVSSRSSSMLSFKAPKITDLGFEKGVLEVSVFVYHLESHQILMKFKVNMTAKSQIC
jgi:hypothetical protein